MTTDHKRIREAALREAAEVCLASPRLALALPPNAFTRDPFLDLSAYTLAANTAAAETSRRILALIDREPDNG